MTKLEAKFQIVFSRWVQNRWSGIPAAFELKRTVTDSLPLSSIREHQVIALKQAATKGIYYKIPDAGFAQSPFDCFFLKGEGYLVVAYGAKLTGFYMIPVGVVERLKNIGVKSITEKTAAEFGTYYELPKRLDSDDNR